MKHVKRPLRINRETIRQLTTQEMRGVEGGRRGEPITPQCPSEYTTCPNSCSN